MARRSQGLDMNFFNVYKRIANVDDDDPIKKVLEDEQIIDIGDFYSLTEGDISTLRIRDPNTGQERTLPLATRKKLQLFVRFYRQEVFTKFSSDPGHGPTASQWSTITAGDFTAFYISAGMTVPGTTPSQNNNNRPTPAQEFQRGVKKDPSVFQHFKDDKMWDNWHTHFVAQARAQELDNILDPEYIPPSTEQCELFVKQQKYVYAVFVSTIQTREGRRIVKAHVDSGDAQQVYML